MFKRKLANTVLITFLFTNILNAEYIDLGVRGPQYEIKEKSFKEEVAAKLKEFDFTLWEKKIADGLDESLKLTSSIEECKETKKWTFDPTMTIENDIVIPYFNKVVYKKGYKYNPLKENNIKFNKYMFFIDADNLQHILLAKRYESVADVFVVKGNVANLKDYNIPAMVYREKIEGKSFTINCLPTVYTQDTDKFIVNEYLILKDSNAQ